MQVTGKTFSIVRNNMPSLRATAMRDFFTILREQGLYTEDNHSKTTNIYTLNKKKWGFDINKYKVSSKYSKDKILNNMVHPEVGKIILESAFK